MGKAGDDNIPDPQGHKVVSGTARADGRGEAEFTGARIVQAEIVQAIGHAGAEAKRTKRRGPQAGIIDRFGADDRALFPKMTGLMQEKNLTAQEAARELGPEIKKRGSLDSAVLRLARRYRKEVERKEGNQN